MPASGLSTGGRLLLIWDRHSGKPLYNGIVWQDRRTADYCRQLKDSGSEGLVKDTTGLLIDPYFSASKVVWILDNEIETDEIECWFKHNPKD